MYPSRNKQPGNKTMFEEGTNPFSLSFQENALSE